MHIKGSKKYGMQQQSMPTRRPTLHLHCTGAEGDETHPQRLTASATCHVPSVGHAARRKRQQTCRTHPSIHDCPASSVESVRSEICSPANETLAVHEVCARQARRSHWRGRLPFAWTSLARRSSSPRRDRQRTNERTNGWSERKRALERFDQ